MPSIPNAPWARIDSFVGNRTAAALTAFRPCPICGADDARAVLELTDFQLYSDSATRPKRIDVRQVQCRACFALYMNPVYTPYGFGVLFAQAGQSYGTSDERPQEQIDWLANRGLVDAGRSVLDVGCYEGRFLEMLPDGVSKIGVDVDAPAIERGRARMAGQDVELIAGDFETFQTGRRPDTMTMFHVLEHVSDPVAVLRKLRSLAHDGSRLVIEVPVVEEGATNDLVGFFSVQHATHFSAASLRNCLARGGWAVVETAGEDLDYNARRVVAAPAGAALPLPRDVADTQAMLDAVIAWQRAARDVGARAVAALGDAPRGILWGGGAHLECLYQRTSVFQQRPDREWVVVDSDALKHGTTWRGLAVLSPAALPELAASGAPVVVSSYGSQTAIAAAARAALPEGHPVVELYDELRVY